MLELGSIGVEWRGLEVGIQVVEREGGDASVPEALATPISTAGVASQNGGEREGGPVVEVQSGAGEGGAEVSNRRTPQQAQAPPEGRSQPKPG